MKAALTRAEIARQRKMAIQRFATAQRAEIAYMRDLRRVVAQIRSVIKVGMTPDQMQMILRNYSSILDPWARAVAEKMVARIAKDDLRAWNAKAADIGRNLRHELANSPIGEQTILLVNEHVHYIKQIPLDAADRIQKITTEAMFKGTRAESVMHDIMQTADVTESRALLIARTEIANAASVLVEARSRHVGSSQYIWRTVGDGTVRDSHKKMDGRVIDWDSPPEVEPGKFYHAGRFPNCRCFADPILPDD